MIVVTAFNGYMAWVQDAELLGLYAIAGALSTPLLVSTGENHEVTLFTYLLVLNVAALVLVALRPWSRLLFAAFVGTVLFVCRLVVRVLLARRSLRRTAFFPHLFLPDLCLRAPAGSGGSGRRRASLRMGQPGAGGVAGCQCGPWFPRVLLRCSTGSSSDWAGAWLAVAFAAFYLSVARVCPVRECCGQVRLCFRRCILPRRWSSSPSRFRCKTHGPMAHHRLAGGGRGAGVGGAAVCVPAAAGAGAAVPGAGAHRAAHGKPARLDHAIFQPALWDLSCRDRGFCLCGVGGAKVQAEEEEPGTGRAVLAGDCRRSGPGRECAYPVGGRLGDSQLLVVPSLARRLESVSHDYRMYAQFSYSAWFMLFGAILLAVGFWRRSAFLRWQALVLLAVTVGKVFLVDISELSQGYRILSFLGLGALLLAVSFVYQRDWLNLRDGRRQGVTKLVPFSVCCRARPLPRRFSISAMSGRFRMPRINKQAAWLLDAGIFAHAAPQPRRSAPLPRWHGDPLRASHWPLSPQRPSSHRAVESGPPRRPNRL